ELANMPPGIGCQSKAIEERGDLQAIGACSPGPVASVPIPPHEHHLFGGHRKAPVNHLALRHIAYGHLRQTLHVTTHTGQQPQDEFEQGAFAATGWAYERGKLPWGEAQIQVGKHRLVGIRSADALQRKQSMGHGYLVAGSWRQVAKVAGVPPSASSMVVTLCRIIPM